MFTVDMAGKGLNRKVLRYGNQAKMFKKLWVEAVAV